MKSPREVRFLTAADAAERAGLPLNMLLTVNRGQLMAGGADGAALGRGEGAFLTALMVMLRRCARRRGVPFYALRAPQTDRRTGHHVHIAMHLPVDAVADVIRSAEALTGARREAPCRLSAGERRRGFTARAECGGWLVQRHRPIGGDGAALAAYLARSAPMVSALRFRVSNELATLVRAER